MKVVNLRDGFCGKCLRAGRCPKRFAIVFNDGEFQNPVLVRKVRQLAYSKHIAPSEWVEYLLSLYQRLDFCICKPCGCVIELDFMILEATDEQIDNGEAERVIERIREWFKAVCCTPVMENITPRVRIEARERFRILATLLFAAFPEETADWPRSIPANDNCKICKVKAANDNKPQV